MYQSLRGLSYSRLCSVTARTQEAVPSGRSVRFSPLSASSKEYISFSTMSVTSPMARLNSGVCSSSGMRMGR